ncbi:non-structural protein NS3 [Changuinola virus]|uniref:Non-structural protein NS3 n=1 Tax=Changuinola virus TaxID=40052 RepID=U5NTQ4_9REOV|nr:non-structural protein NS3 [Changuinola virus]AGY34651.1 non-structural protein NS3 [Changuinola virus]AGZ92002.1 non structural protein NS3 [Changuinola virus]
MLSELAARFEAGKQRELEEVNMLNETAVVPYTRPPSYAPTAPTTFAPAHLSLNILNNAMSNGTAKTNALKEEKVAFGSYAEAFRDEPAVQQIKSHVNEQIIPKLKRELAGYKKKRWLVHLTMLIAAGVALFTSLGTLVKDVQIRIPGNNSTAGANEYIHLPTWYTSLGAIFGIVNLGATGLMISCARIEKSYDESIAFLKKELMKKRSYNDAIRMSIKDMGSLTNLFSEEQHQ